MNDSYSDLLVQIEHSGGSANSVKATLHDGSDYEGSFELTEEDLYELRVFENDPIAYGKLLFKKLFQGQIWVAYAVANGLARKQSGGRLRVRLLLARNLPIQLQTLKWERVCPSERSPQLPLAVDEFTPFSRHTSLPRQQPAPLDTNYVNLLIVVASPSNLDEYGMAQLDVSQQLGRLARGLQEVLASQRCKVTVMPGRSTATLAKDVRATLEASGCTILDNNSTLDAITEHIRDQHILHFLGHGQYLQGEGVLYLEAADGTVEIADEDLLTARLANSQLQLIFLAACESAHFDEEAASDGGADAESPRGLASTLVTAGIGSVVAMQTMVSIDAAYKLTGEFYRRLFLEHGSVDRALNQARKLLYNSNDGEWATPVLFSRLPGGQLLSVNPLFAALKTARTHSDYDKFRQTTPTITSYFDLPLHAVLVNPGQQFTAFAAADVQPTGTVALIDAAWQWLSDPRPCSSVLLILGGPGTSKSTQLKQLGWKSIEEGLAWAGRDCFIPIYLDQQLLPVAATSSVEALEQQILAKLKLFWNNENDESLTRLADLPAYVRLRVLVNGGDALPEVANDLLLQMSTLAQTYSKHQFVLALQPIVLRWKQFDPAKNNIPTVLAIQPLAQRTLRHYLEAQAGFGQTLLDAIQDAYLFDLASIPYFMIRMLRSAQAKQTPRSRTNFLKQVLDEGIAKLPAGDGLRANALRTLQALAWEMQSLRAPIWSINNTFALMQRVREQRGYQSEAMYNALVHSELLQPVGEDNMRFAYRSIQAYLCAEAALAQPDRTHGLQEIVGKLGFPSGLYWWEETVVILCGLLANHSMPDATKTLRKLLEPLIYGANLMEGDAVFVAARCLVECYRHARQRTWQDLVEHVVNALRWRADCNNEPQLTQRLRATQLLAQLAMPRITLLLARTAYEKVRRNLADEMDYEFSSIRFAASIVLKKLSPPAAAAELDQINPQITALFQAWKSNQLKAVINFSQMSDDPGIQGIAALALGDLYSRLQHKGATAEDAFNRLLEMFTDSEMRQSVRWPVVDALSLLNLTLVRQRLIYPLLDEFDNPDTSTLKRPDKIRKSLAYLIGLLRLSDPQTRHFLLEGCLGIKDDTPLHNWSAWSTAIGALGRISDLSDAPTLVEIASGYRHGVDMRTLFDNDRQRNHIRSEALTALSTLGGPELLDEQIRQRLANDPNFNRTFYRVMRTMYWRQGMDAENVLEANQIQATGASSYRQRHVRTSKPTKLLQNPARK